MLDVQHVESDRVAVILSGFEIRCNLLEEISMTVLLGGCTFSICSFWLVEALTRAGCVEEARLMFEKMLGYANHVGLYAEEIGYCGEALGNFPQAFTLLGLISAAFNLDRALLKNPCENRTAELLIFGESHV